MGHGVAGLAPLLFVALKALLLYVTAVIGFRLCKRRLLSDLSPFDFIAAVAVGAIVGRIPSASDATYLRGAVTLVTVLLAHAAITRLRQFPRFMRVIEHAPRIIVADGEILEDELRRCGLTRGDLQSLLRRQGVHDLATVRYLIVEQRGQISLITDKAPSAASVTDDLFAAVEAERTLNQAL
jgi:uncharacterized membrane protein YcaP (DUF421 family)